jgi:hypothetical protein
LLVLERFRHVAIDDPERQALRDRGLADSGFADQDRIVLGPARQHLDRAADFIITANHRIELAFACGLCQIAGIFLERIETLLGAGAVGSPALADVINGLIQCLRGQPGIGQNLRGLAEDSIASAINNRSTVTKLSPAFFAASSAVWKYLSPSAATDRAGRCRHLLWASLASAASLARRTSPVDRRRVRSARMPCPDHHPSAPSAGAQARTAGALRPRHGLCRLDETANAFRVFFNIHALLLYMSRPLRRATVGSGQAPDCGKPY